MSEHCQICGKKYESVYEVSDKLWKEVTGIENGSGLRCMSCLEKQAKKMGIYIHWYGNFLEYVKI